MAGAIEGDQNTCVCRKPHPCWWSERIGYPGGMIALILFVLGILASPFKLLVAGFLFGQVGKVG